MRIALSTPPGRRKRSGKVLVMFALLLPILLGMVGLVIDGGRLMAAHRQAHNGADAAALAGALERLRGRSVAAARTTATRYATTYNGLDGATVTVNIPPSS